MADQRQAPESASATHVLWFPPPAAQEQRRQTLTRQRVVAEALSLISADGVEAFSMRALAARLGVVPGALYRHVHSKEQLQDLVVDGVLAEVDREVDRTLPWARQVAELARRLRSVLEGHPGVAALLKARDPVSPHSLALAEAFLTPLHAAGLSERQTALAYRLIYDYTLGFALSDPTSAGEQRVQDTTTRRQLQAFLRALPADRFPMLANLGEHLWAINRDERFNANLDTLISGLQATPPEPTQASPTSTQTTRRPGGHPPATPAPGLLPERPRPEEPPT